METQNLHTYVVCAYGESPYLEECVQSLLAQTVSSTIKISTATPNADIERVAAQYNIPCVVREGTPSITGDWNFAMSLADTPYVTLAHQDDRYEPTYTEAVLERAEKDKRPILLFTDYFEIRDGKRVYKNRRLRLKRMLNVGFRLFPKSRWIRRRILSLGNSICCPSVTFSREGCRDFTFDSAYRFACDWDAWERLSKRKGTYRYLAKPLMGHRIHVDSETTKQSSCSRRKEEEIAMLRRFWPVWIAKRLVGQYGKDLGVASPSETKNRKEGEENPV